MVVQLFALNFSNFHIVFAFFSIHRENSCIEHLYSVNFDLDPFYLVTAMLFFITFIEINSAQFFY